MKNNKIYMRIMTLMIVIAMIFTTAANAVTFTDISKHWAKDYIQEVASKGLVTGYDNGTFKPEANLTVLESLIIMSRLYNINDDLKEQIVDKYKPIIKKMPNASDYEWAYEGLSIALELGIVSENGLKSMFEEKTIAKDASKEEIAVLLTKAMLLGDEAKNLKVYTLPFSDVSKITTAARPYIYVMYDKGIVQGDQDKNINPKDIITRAVMATMIDRTYDYIQDNKVVPKFEGYKPTTTIKGVITEVTTGGVESYIYVKKDDGDITIVRINDSTKIYLNDSSSTISKIQKGTLASCKIDDQRIASSINVDGMTKVINGTIHTVAYSAPAKLTVLDENKNKVSYDIPSENVTILLDGKTVQFKNLVEKDLVTIMIKNNVVYQINSTSRIQNYDGKITAIDYNNLPIKLTIKNSKNDALMTFEYTSDTEVTRNKQTSSFDQVRVGDEVTVSTEYDKLIKINTKAADAEISGTIKEILIAPQCKIKIADTNGSLKEYTVSNNVKINIGSKNSSIYDLRLGYQVEVNTSGDQIVTIEAAEIQTAKNFSGKIILVNQEDKLLMMQNIKDNGQTELIYLRITNSTKIFNTAGSTKYLKDIIEGNNIISTAISQGGEYVAVSIMIQ